MEVIFVIDGSPDESLHVLRKNINKCEFKTKIVVLAKNVGSLIAVRAGIDYSSGKFIATKAADLQEPIQLLEKFFFSLLKDEADIILGIRTSRKDPRIDTLASRIFWTFYNKFIDASVPKGGVDIFAINERVKPYISQMTETHSSLFGYLFWLGFRKIEIPYQRKKRQIGKSSWTTSKKISYMLDSLFSFSTLPIVLFFIIGSMSAFSSFVFGMFIFIGRLTGQITVPGYSATALISLFFFGIITVELSIISNYIWRTYENTKHRPQYIIQETHDYQPE
jgi:glycosyltransferase involved in cell wall biosynthesis